MVVATTASDGRLPLATRQLLRRMLSPSCGLAQTVGVIMRGRLDPRFVITGAELTGVHVLLDQPAPGSYHIGGMGVFLQESLIRTLGESVERYAQFISALSGRHRMVVASYDEMRASGRTVLSEEQLAFFSEDQLAVPGFRFEGFQPDRPMKWVEATSLIEPTSVWVPAQLVLVGYHVARAGREPWLTPAVTTGTAAHTSRVHALRNALLELVQIDAAMGHWYSGQQAPAIRLDERVRALGRIVERQFGRRLPRPSFHWLRSPDLDAHVVACVVDAPMGRTPRIAVGLGADLALEPAMYRALLEAVGVLQLAKVNLVMAQVGIGRDGRVAANPAAAHNGNGTSVDPEQIQDLDSNVAYYATEDVGDIATAFTRSTTVSASELPPDAATSPDADVDALVACFKETGKELLLLDLTSEDIRELGFVVLRTWSPDTLGMSLPSLPPLAHPRFDAFGGARHRRPHPYP